MIDPFESPAMPLVMRPILIYCISMLFAVKNRLVPTLLLLAVFVVGSMLVRNALGLEWQLSFRDDLLGELLLAIGVMAVSDGAIHVLLTVLVGAPYRARYLQLVEYFRPQRMPEIIAGGLLAGEELVFRGLLLEGLCSRAGISSGAAVAATAMTFGLLHALPRRQLWPFALWAVWEGALLGGIYVASGSLLLVVVLHVLHDSAGFTLFAFQRRGRGTGL